MKVSDLLDIFYQINLSCPSSVLDREIRLGVLQQDWVRS